MAPPLPLDAAARPEQSRVAILAAMKQWFRKPSALPAIRILEGRQPDQEAPSFFMEVPRIILVLKGTATFSSVEKGRERIFDVQAGQLLYLAGCTWICPIPKKSYQSLGIVMHDKATRFAIHARELASRRKAITSRYIAEWRTNETIGESGLHLQALLKAPCSKRIKGDAYAPLLRHLMAHLLDLLEHAAGEKVSIQSIRWQSVSDYISDHWSDPMISRTSVAKFFHCHPNHFSRFFHNNAGTNFRAYLNEIRLERSLTLLANFQNNVADVAYLCGFTDAQYFIQCFRKRYGFTPGNFQKRDRA